MHINNKEKGILGEKKLKQRASALGFATVILFCVALFAIGLLTPSFNFLTDYISLLGASGQPLSMIWNVVGFGFTGTLFGMFGWTIGCVVGDRIMGGCLVLMGLGFVFAAAPTDFANAESPLSKIHFASICIALAGWCFALARIGQNEQLDRTLRTSSKLALVLAIAPFIGLAGIVLPEPTTHRLVLAVIFGWTLFLSTIVFRQSD